VVVPAAGDLAERCAAIQATADRLLLEEHKAPKEARREAHLCIGTGGMAMLPPPEFSPAPGREIAAPGGN
jgi:hypothetical protein